MPASSATFSSCGVLNIARRVVGFKGRRTRVQQLEIAGQPADPSKEYAVSAAGEQTIGPIMSGR
jgi:hypothetical protein